GNRVQATVGENRVKFPLLNHIYKLNFFKNTTVTRVASFDNNTRGFKFEHFTAFTSRRFSDTELCDVIGTIVSISDAIPFNTFGVEKLKKTVILEDVEVILAPTHEQVDKVNERMLAKLPAREKVCYSSDYVSDVDIGFKFNESLYTTEFLNMIKMSGIPHQKLVLKIGAPVMCLRNIDQRGGLCNGTRLQVLRMSINNIEAKIISGGKVGTVVAIPLMNNSPSDKKMHF
ncbi:ATP-dependent DNA helicase PIF1-like protein, partial [Tanacetum coccineum]